jgi:hypothetical protein
VAGGPARARVVLTLAAVLALNGADLATISAITSDLLCAGLLALAASRPALVAFWSSQNASRPAAPSGRPHRTRSASQVKQAIYIAIRYKYLGNAAPKR